METILRAECRCRLHPNCNVSARTCRLALMKSWILIFEKLEWRMPVGLQIEHQPSGPPARCDQTSLSQVADRGCFLVSPLFVADSFEAAGMPAGLQVEAPGESREVRVQPPVPQFGMAEKLSCTRLSRCFLNFWRMQMGIHWQPAGSNPARPIARSDENSHQPLSPICRFCDECRWNYIPKKDEVPGSNPGGFNKWGHSSTVERVKYVSSILSSQFFATNAGVTTCKPLVAGSNPASGLMNDRSSSVGRAAENVSPNLVVAFLSVVSNRIFAARMPLELHRSRVRVSPAPSDGAVAQW